MIDVKELRIGNLVTLNCDSYAFRKKGNIISVGGVADCGVNPYSNYEGEFVAEYEFRDMEGIPLTEEWLLKFGFEKMERDGWFHINVDFGGIQINVYTWETWLSDINNITGKQINQTKYVHQLQNLYFALTGQELTIKESVK